MARAIYSRRIVSQHGLGSGVTFEIPLDPTVVWVVRDMDAFIAGAGGGAVQVNDDHSTTFWEDEQHPPDVGVWMQWHGRQVFEPVASLYVTFTVLDPLGHGDIRISGYALTP